MNVDNLWHGKPMTIGKRIDDLTNTASTWAGVGLLAMFFGAWIEWGFAAALMAFGIFGLLISSQARWYIWKLKYAVDRGELALNQETCHRDW